MARSSAVFKDAYNRALDILDDVGARGRLPSESVIAEHLSVSRTTVRAVLDRLRAQGLIAWNGRYKTVLRAPQGTDRFGDEETQTTAQKIETRFMEYVLGGDLEPGAVLRESELARTFGTSPSAVREFLIRFSRFGLIEKQPNRHWVLRGFTRAFAIELFDVREMFELKAFEVLLADGPESAARAELIAMAPAFREVAERDTASALALPRLDERFHRLLMELLKNRFADDFFEIVPLIFHYHYRWNKADEAERNRVACREHLAIIEALDAGDDRAALALFRVHLASSRRTLLASVRWDEPA
ncbi:GntR family transcriptional regulator [Tropicimonas sp. IMCC6043]|uniref:GntR family transcriptional regulator n=1 Tax=Tropicimonas sp. IMCC6043 TaxID=2510645 RepID=UPI00101C76C4|nr:GntR family transcriptional regulator [Tropicimonas sp. IMCC6043]RYH08502.1 GntR family transcriptional regulator [Tropicimonas sp. IMCC6043]